MPSQIIQELQELTAMSRTGVEALYEAENELAEKEHELDVAENKAFIQAQGTVADRTALARLESAQMRFERDLARAKVNRIKMKLKVLESQIMANATMSKILQAEMKL
jgi:hypothetical protein